MPNNDGTGPNGEGPRTGRMHGPCGRGYHMQGNNRGMGRMGFGRNRFSESSLSKEEQKRLLETELNELETEKEAIKRRLQELSA